MKKADIAVVSGDCVQNGVTQTEFGEWHDAGWRTIYSWRKQLDIDESSEQAMK